MDVTRNTPLPHHLYTSLYECDILLLPYLSNSKGGKNRGLLSAKVVNDSVSIYLLR